MGIEKDKLIDFINKKRKKAETKRVGVAVPSIHSDNKPLPWWKRPLEADEFTSKLAKNGRWYVRHKEWSKNTWIGPYKEHSSCQGIINSYVLRSLECNLIGKTLPNGIHSVIIDNPKDFF